MFKHDVQSDGSTIVLTDKALDYLFRLTSDEAGRRVTIKTVGSTDTIRERLREWSQLADFHVETLARVVDAQQRLLDYNGYYNAFLSGQLSEEEFEETTNTFVYEPSEVEIGELSNRISCLLTYTTADFAPSDLADIFQCDRESVRRAIGRLKHDSLAFPDQN